MIRVISSLLQLSSSSASSSPFFPISSSFIAAARDRQGRYQNARFLRILRSATSAEECNEEEGGLEKEIGKLSVEKKSEEQIKVLGRPPIADKKPSPEWTGLVEKNTAAETDIDNVKPGQPVTVAIAIALGVVLALGLLVQYGGVTGNTESIDAPVLSHKLNIQELKPEVVIDAPGSGGEPGKDSSGQDSPPQEYSPQDSFPRDSSPQDPSPQDSPPGNSVVPRDEDVVVTAPLEAANTDAEKLSVPINPAKATAAANSREARRKNCVSRRCFYTR